MGGGRVAQSLATLWHRCGHFLVQDVLTTSLASAQSACAVIGSGRAVASLQSMRPADVWMLAVTDAQIAGCAQSLAEQFAHERQAANPAPIVFHCSGAQSSATLEPLAALGWHVASAHCILSFATVAAALQQFPGTPCALEGDSVACEALRPAFTAIGARCFDVASADKLLYHAAAVFATNFLPVLQSVAEDAWAASGVPAELLPHLRQTLLDNAVRNVTTLGPAGALTGPAARGDTAHITRQSAVVHRWNDDAGQAYDALSALALALARRNND